MQLTCLLQQACQLKGLLTQPLHQQLTRLLQQIGKLHCFHGKQKQQQEQDQV